MAEIATLLKVTEGIDYANHLTTIVGPLSLYRFYRAVKAS
jgi:hypothetical protein